MNETVTHEGNPETEMTDEHRKNLYEAQKEWAEHVFGELTEEEAVEVRPDLHRLVRERSSADEAEE